MSTAQQPGAIEVAPIEDTSLLAFYRDMNVPERRTFWACFTGWTLDGMDFMIYPLVIGTIIALWKVDPGTAGLAGTVTLLASAIGGWGAGYLCDRIGRVKTLQLTVIWFSFFSLVCAFVQNFEQLFIARALLGLGFGGEWAAGAVLIGEIIRDEHRGKGNGVVHSGWAVGWGAAALLYTLFFYLLPEDIAWRALFAAGLLPALLVIFLRRLVSEPEVFLQNQRKMAASGANRLAFLEIFTPKMLYTTVLASLLAVGAQGGYYAIMIWLPTYLKTVRGLSVLSTGGYLAIIIVASFLGYVISAYLTDILGRRKNFFLFSGCSIVTVLLYMFAPIGDTVLFLLGAPLGFFASGIYSGIGAFFNELFPTRIRGSGIGFCFNFGRAVGALFPALVGFLSATIPLGQAIGLFTVGAYALIVAAALMLPETKGRSLMA